MRALGQQRAGGRLQAPGAAGARAVASLAAPRPAGRRAQRAAAGPRHRRTVCRAAAETKQDEAQPTQEASSSGNWVPVILPEELPKGFRKEVKVDGVDVLLFWYRNQIYAIEARSPAEGAYSEGFMNARLNQDYCIACPSTGTLFSLKTGEIVDWYPNNPVLRFLTPKDTCRPLDIFPVKLTQEAISVDVSRAALTASSPAGKGGSDTSIDANNVFGVESKPYLEVQDPVTGEIDQEALNQVNPYVLAVSLFAIGAAGVAGSAFALYKDSYIALGLIWAGVLALAVYSVRSYTPLGGKK